MMDGREIAMSGNVCIQVAALSKSFGEVTAVDSVSFDVYEGELFGFLGPNGAGKTTTINMLTGLARPDAGRLIVGGIDCSNNPKAAQHRIGVVPDESNLYPELTGFENLCFCGGLYGMPSKARRRRALELLEIFGLDGAASRRFSGYSKGMKRRLVIAAGMMHHPPILFLDEPTTGIDVQSARQIRSMLGDLHRSGTTIFLTTHYIEEAERLCDRIAFIVGGSIVHIDSVHNLLQPVRGQEVMLLSVEDPQKLDLQAFAAAFPGCSMQRDGTSTIRISAQERIAVAPLVRYLEMCGVEVVEARRKQLVLEDVFLRLTGLDVQIMQKETDKKRKK